MKSITKNVHQNKLTQFLVKQPLKDYSNLLDDEKKYQKHSVNLPSPKKGKHEKTEIINQHLSKRNNEEFENANISKKLRISSPVKTSLKQKTINDYSFDDVDDVFFQNLSSIEEEFTSRNLDLSKLDKYKIENVEITACNDIKLTVENVTSYKKGTCILKSPWNGNVLNSGMIVSLKGRWNSAEDNPSWIVDWNGGIVVTDPDHLVSGTTVVNSLYCARKTVLSTIFKEQPNLKTNLPSTAMFVGSTVHELLQKVLETKTTQLREIENLFKDMIDSKQFKIQIFLENFNYEEVIDEIAQFVPKIYEFVAKYVNQSGSSTYPGKKSEQNGITGWPGEITDVKDIEENIWSHKLGMKGKIDATVQVRINNKIKIVPLEIKTGKVQPLNLKHRGQVILYCMMLKEQGVNIDSGLLLYLRDGENLLEVKSGERECRDLILLRNRISYWLRKMSSVEPAANILPPHLPQVINRHTCQSCPQLITCASVLRRSGEINTLDDNHILKKVGLDSTLHLTNQHLEFVFHWLGLLLLEFGTSKFSVSRIWNIKPEEREAKGWCIGRMKVQSSISMKECGWDVTFVKMDNSYLTNDFEIGQTVVISTSSDIAISMGTIKKIDSSALIVKLNRDVKNIQPPIYIDRYKSTSINTILMNNLGILLQNTPHIEALRQSLIEKKIPTFAPKISSKVKIIGQDIFARLNNEQMRAVLQAIAAERYILIKGVPGAGKTATMRALIELLVRLDKRIIVTSFTHSAIDNILLGLPVLEKGLVLRLGSLHRIHPLVARFASEDKLLMELDGCISSKGLEDVYAKRKVVGVTCLGCNHGWLERQRFDICLVDEATQVNLPALIKPLSLADKFILVGDPKQLPPLVLSKEAKQNGLAVSLFEKLDRPAVTSKLTLQYRMNSCITKLANDFNYDGQLKCGTDQVALNTISYNEEIITKCPKWLQIALDTSLNRSVVIIDVVMKNESNEVFENKLEGNVIVEITNVLKQVGISLSSVGVMATYRDQVNLLRQLLHSDIEVNTVDQYQGRDKEIILFSTTRSSENAACNGILNDVHRLTVAITRAKKKLIIIGNINILKSYPNFSKIINNIPTENTIKFES